MRGRQATRVAGAPAGGVRWIYEDWMSETIQGMDKLLAKLIVSREADGRREGNR